MSDIYTSGKYLQATTTWHAEDAPWKAREIAGILSNNRIVANNIAEIGCGSGAILDELSRLPGFGMSRFCGYDISPQAIEIASKIDNERVRFRCEDMLASQQNQYDLLLVIDVFEHIKDYLGFIDACRGVAEYKLYHIPLELHMSSLLRNVFLSTRYSIGHIHYFSADWALAVLRDTGHEIVDSSYTNPAFDLFHLHPSFKKALANGPRWILSRFSTAFAARMLGGYSLLVLTR